MPTTNTYLNSPPMWKLYQGQSQSPESLAVLLRRQSVHTQPSLPQRRSRGPHSGFGVSLGQYTFIGRCRRWSKKAVFPCRPRTWETNTLQMANEPFASVLSSNNKCVLFQFLAIYLSGNKRVTIDSSNDIWFDQSTEKDGNKSYTKHVCYGCLFKCCVQM
jgi:hypothetical protein